MEWKWSYGGTYEKSMRKITIPTKKTVLIEKTAIQQSLLSENDSWLMNQQGELFILDKNKDHEQSFNKREDTYHRMAEREMIGQIGMNPFSDNNYLHDVIAQDNFLKPVSTSSEKEK
uniref:Uncharacterized protein n=1 Tax=viral metagenome TaxID=1070528 RepID=A0A6C0BAD8_9ZZZZ